MSCYLNTSVIRTFQLGYPVSNFAIFLQTHHGNAGLIPLNTKHPTHQVPERAAVVGAHHIRSLHPPAIFNQFSHCS